jgi:hypothetical protein
MHKLSSMVLAAAAVLLVACLWGGAMTTVARAEMINIQLSNFPLRYENEEITDAASPVGGEGNVADASPLGPVTVSVNGVIKYTYGYGALLGDLLITGVRGLEDIGFSRVQADGPVDEFGFDLLEPSGQKFLSLNFNRPEVYYYADPLSGLPTFVLTSGVATINEQNLPNGIVLTPDDTVTFSLNGTQFTHLEKSDGFVTHFDTSAVGSISGDGTIPEPSTLVLLGMGAAGLLAYAWRRRRS